jgi:hypothetical protein
MRFRRKKKDTCLVYEVKSAIYFEKHSRRGEKLNRICQRWNNIQERPLIARARRKDRVIMG